MFEHGDSRPSIAERLTARAAASPAWDEPFGVLCRTFFAQFFTSEVATSNIRFHQAMIGVFTVLLMPGVMMMMAGLSRLDKVELQARQLHASGMLEPVLADLASLLITYSMLIVSFVAAVEWNALGFERRDAMVLGPLPIAGSTIVCAKLAALGGLLVASAALVNLLPTAAFALTTAPMFGLIGFVRYLAAYIIATLGAAVFVFAAIVTVRGTVALVAGARLAARLGSLLQFLFIAAFVSSFLVVMTASRPESRMTSLFEFGSAIWAPTGWFLSLFEWVRGANGSGFVVGATRAMLATMIALGGATFVSIAGFKRQSQLALTPSSSVGALTRVSFSRACAWLMTAGDPVAQSTAQFILWTVARCRAQQELIAINAAIGAALAIAGLARSAAGSAPIITLRTAVLWIPFLLAYFLSLGLRASFFVPSELPCSWTFRINSSASTAASWAATRAAMLALVLPPTAIVAAFILLSVGGWRMVPMHVLFTCVVATLLIELLALMIDFVPFTRAYPPGHANLKSRWGVYVLGVFVFAYWPARLQLWAIQTDAAVFKIIAVIALPIIAIEIAGRYRGRAREEYDEQLDDLPNLSVLDIGVVRR